MSKTMGGAQTRSMTCSPTPIPIADLERTREIQAVLVGADAPQPEAPNAVPAQIVPSEETVPVQASIESSLLHEVLRRESAEKDK